MNHALFEKFLNAFEGRVGYSFDGDPEGHYIYVAMDNLADPYKMLTRDGSAMKKSDTELMEYGKDYTVRLFAEYYPVTENIAIRTMIDLSDNLTWDEIEYMWSSEGDRMVNGYIILSEEEETALRAAIKDYANEELAEFPNANAKKE